MWCNPAGRNQAGDQDFYFKNTEDNGKVPV